MSYSGRFKKFRTIVTNNNYTHNLFIKNVLMIRQTIVGIETINVIISIEYLFIFSYNITSL